MSSLFDDLARAAVAPMPRRQVLGVLLGAVTAALWGSLRAQGPPCEEDLYPIECGDICCMADYPCRSSTILNGGDVPGVCCQTAATYCNDGIYGWCCGPTGKTGCGAEAFSCGCAVGQETCGQSCCGTDEFCCNPDEGLCCAKQGGVCCYQFEQGKGCAEDEKCVPLFATGSIGNNVCCPEPRAAKGQCCPEGFISTLGNSVDGFLYCCPAARATTNRAGCCPPYFAYAAATDTCCIETALCNGNCCASGRCVNGQCEPCAGGPQSCAGACCPPGDCCFGTCCANNTCCFGKCCGAGTVCTGECTKLETVQAQIGSAGGFVSSTDQEEPEDAVTGAATQPAFQAYIPTTVLTSTTQFTYTSQETPSAALPAGLALLRSFTFTGQGLSEMPGNYFLYTSFTPATLGALGIASEEDLDLLYRDGDQWVSLLQGCTFCSVNALLATVAVQTTLLGEFALAARTTPVYLPYIGA
jgi:hypothetical protein